MTVPFLNSRGIDIKRAIGSSAAIGLPISIAGTAGYIFNGWGKITLETLTLGYVHLPAVLLISITSTLMAPVGASLAHKLPVDVLKKCFGVLLIAISVNMLLALT